MNVKISINIYNWKDNILYSQPVFTNCQAYDLNNVQIFVENLIDSQSILRLHVSKWNLQSMWQT